MKQAEKGSIYYLAQYYKQGKKHKELEFRNHMVLSSV